MKSPGPDGFAWEQTELKVLLNFRKTFLVPLGGKTPACTVTVKLPFWSYFLSYKDGFKDNSSTAEVENKRDCPNVETKSTDDRVIVEEKQNKISIDQDQDNSMKISPRLSEMDNTKSSESLDEQIEASKVGEDDVIEADNIEIQDGTPRDIGPVAPMVCFSKSKLSVRK